ncbi:MFS transporter [Calycomorphotria hydatis]|uniref:Major Facilitator Superfamily protein n=1 Tax=Calycomorphotria hydatis TaxID=2528027 RepID=A0A517T6M5_9PLAN|nr:MFS transporter [Calycomorphotria hydatis]QDT64026.1 Major Facilitator Superfamily protein [Calycomorphotria hydatis]
MSKAASEGDSAASGVIRDVALNQLLWTAGYPLTSGGFLLFFAKELGAGALIIAVLLSLPETVGISGLLTRWLLRRGWSRRVLFLGGSILSRALMLAIPTTLLLSNLSPATLLAVLLVSFAISHAVGSIAYVAFLSWVSDLVPENRWGKVFAWRNMAKLLAMLTVPVSVGYLHRSLTAEATDTQTNWIYGTIFLSGLILQCASLLPVWNLREFPYRGETVQLPEWAKIKRIWQNEAYRPLLLHNWLLALANGLTQSAFFLYATGGQFLAISLGTYYLLSALMRGMQFPVSAWAGTKCDHGWSLKLRIWGTFLGSSGLIFWLIASAEQWWWLVAAYLCWGAYAAANIAGSRLMLAAANSHENAAEIGLFRQVGGLLAGLSGLAGGLLLNQWLPKADSPALIFLTLFAVSLGGRYLSLIPLMWVKEPDPFSENEKKVPAR